MRASFTLLFILICLTGCSQNDDHDFHSPRKIPIEAGRWYQLNTPVGNLAELFDNNQYQQPDPGKGGILNEYDAWYPVLDGEQITIDSIMMFSWKGADESRPMTIYAIQNDWKKVPIAVFTGKNEGGWNGPDPAKSGAFALAKPVTNIRYLVINSHGFFPGELEFYGAYKQPKPIVPMAKRSFPLSNYFGINAFEWDFSNPADALNLDPVRLSAIKSFTGVRHYLDWEKLEPIEGSYTFSPARNGSWNYDIIYHWCKAQGIEVLACVKTIPAWLQAATPSAFRHNENVPAKFGKDLLDPASYIEQARLGFQFAARYGSNAAIDPVLIKVDTAMAPWLNGPKNRVRTGLGLITYIECDNERDKWWRDRKAYQTGREYAANLSAFYDGHKNTMGPGVGVKNADPAMKVVMAGLAAPVTDYVRGMIDWSREHRGVRADGSPDLPWDIINYHYYCNDEGAAGNNEKTSGMAPELTTAAVTAAKFVSMAHQYAGDMPVWVTESGYDIHQESTQRAIAINNTSALETQADWSLRTCLLFARTGIQRSFFYELVDDNASSTNYATSGLINGDRTRRPAASFMYQANKLFGKYEFSETISKDPLVDRYTANGRSMYVLLIPDQKGRTATYTLDIGNAENAYIYTPAPGKEDMGLREMKTTNGKVTVTVTERPVFVTGYKL